MKRFLLIAAILLITLVLVNIFVLKDEGLVNQAGKSYQPKETDSETVQTGIGIGNIAPSFTLKDLAGNEVSLEDFRGKKVLLNFWASWCPPCRAEMPDMESYYQKHHRDGYVVLAVNMTTTEKNPGDGAAYIKSHQFTFPVLIDEKGTVRSLYNVISLPTSYFIDSNGIIRDKVSGPMTAERIEKGMEKLP